MTAVEALAESWASIDGKLAGFYADKENKDHATSSGHYEGYMSEAEEMIRRLRGRGFDVVPLVVPPALP